MKIEFSYQSKEEDHLYSPGLDMIFTLQPY